MKPARTPRKKSIASTAANPCIVIEAKIDVGFGNALFVRGSGGGLDWNKGIPLTCCDGDTWRLSMGSNEKITFKLLLNDQVWAQGDDLVAQPGETIKVTPQF